jgi:predicted PurR-regulated permease PerM
VLSPIDSRTSRILFTALLFVLALSFLYYVRHTLIAFLFAIFFAYLMDPLVSRMAQPLRGRGRAIAAIYCILLILAGVFVFFVGPRIARQADRLEESLPSILENVSSGQIAEQIGAQRGWSFQTRQRLKNLLISHRQEVTSIAERVGFRLGEVAQKVWLLFLVPILSIFFLKDGKVFGDVLAAMVQSRPQREFLQGVLDDLNQMLAHFIRAQLTLAALSMIVYSSMLGLMRVPYAMMLGTVGGVMEFVPVIGPLVAAILIVGVSMLQGYAHWLVLIVLLGVWRLVQDYGFTPKIMGEKMRLHPLAAIFGVLAGGEVAGVLGIYLSIPIMASLRIVWKRWQLYAEKRTFGPLSDYAFGAQIGPRQ